MLVVFGEEVEGGCSRPDAHLYFSSLFSFVLFLVPMSLVYDFFLKGCE